VSRTLYVSNLPLSATEDSLVAKFGRFGTVVSVRITRDLATGRSLGHAFIQMMTGSDAQNAMNGLNLTDYDGRLMSVNKAVVFAQSVGCVG
jgi:RNA recognition motif-containing protein